MDLDNATVYILESVPVKFDDQIVSYLVSLQVEWNCFRSKPFLIQAKNTDQLLAKASVEIAKFKNMILNGFTHLFEKVC